MADYKDLLLWEGKEWSIYLHENQCYLGRAYLWAHRDDDIDLLEMTDAEREEFFRLGTALKATLNGSFKPDRINYAALSNTSHHLHIHVIPRYDSSRIFLRQEFTDKNQGKNYAPYDRDFHVDWPVLRGIRDTLKNALAREIEDGSQ